MKMIVGVLPKVTKEFILDNKYRDIRKREFAKKPGVYALYKAGKLYYVGQASNLRGRLNHHLKYNKHSGKWDSCSIYLTKTESDAKELEAIALSLLRPKGNTQQPKFREDKDMTARILKAMGKINEEMFGGKRRSQASGSKRSARTSKAKNRTGFEEVFSENQSLKAEYKAKTYFAKLLPCGKRVQYGGKPYGSPTAAAKAIIGYSPNGLTFWRIQDSSGKWVTLKSLKKPSSSAKNRTGFEGMFSENQPLKAEYKAKTYFAKLLPCGKRVQYGGKPYSSPTAAAKAIIGYSPNGLTFWRIQDSSGKWVTLKSLKKSFADKAS